MRVKSLTAEGVHGYMELNISFYSDLTFLVGLNGSGKTTALRLLMGLLTPDVEELVRIDFHQAAVCIVDGDEDFVVEAKRISDGLHIGLKGIRSKLKLSTAEMQALLDMGRRDESRSPVLARITKHPTIERIAELSTPMFLGLDRKFLGESSQDDYEMVRRRRLYARRMPELHRTGGSLAQGLMEVCFLVQHRMNEIRAQQERLDDNLRMKLLAGAFRYRSTESRSLPPAAKALKQLQEDRTAAERAIRNLRIPAEEISSALDQFFDQMDLLLSALQEEKPTRKSADARLLEWHINRPQFERITEHLSLVADYDKRRLELHEPMDRYLGLVNSFLQQTKKELLVSRGGSLHVMLNGKWRSVDALSSGERQLVVMLGHLALNERMSGSGVFIVDEPELSLHVSWQERFVEAVRAANPDVQFIMATHSPAIILDRDENCRDLAV